MNILSLFDGMSCGRIAAERAGFDVENYYASELDKYAIKVTQANWPNTIQLGDVTKWREWDIDWPSIDLLIGGSPCQGFSFAGKQLAFDDPRSKLFFVYEDILNYIKLFNPDVKFMLENVKMKKEFLSVISDRLEVDPIFINSGDYSYCERPRYYWANFEILMPEPIKKSAGEVIDFTSYENTMSQGWHAWWIGKSLYQIGKKYSRIVSESCQFITMTTRQYASWNGNFIPTPSGLMRKPTKKELALLVGANPSYFDSVSQRNAEELTGNGWTVDVIAHIFNSLQSKKDL